MATKTIPLQTVEQREAALRTLVDAGLTFAEVMTVFGARQSARGQALIAHAHKYLARENEMEVDPGRSVASLSDEPDDFNRGWVLAWLWVDPPTPLSCVCGAPLATRLHATGCEGFEQAAREAALNEFEMWGPEGRPRKVL